MASESFDRLYEQHFIAGVGLPAAGDLGPVFWFAVINVVILTMNLGAAELVHRRADLTSHTGAARLLMASSAVLAISVIGFGLAGNFALAVTMFCTARLLLWMEGDKIHYSYINQDSLEQPLAGEFKKMAQAR